MNLIALPMRLISLAFIIGAALEIVLLFWVGHTFGATVAWLIVIGGIFVGSFLLQRAGRRALSRVREATQGTYAARQGGGASTTFQFLAGILISTPGVISTCVGLLLLLPFVQGFVRTVALAWFGVKHPIGFAAGGAARAAGARFAGRRNSSVVEGEVVEGETTTGPPPTESGLSRSIEGQVVSSDDGPDAAYRIDLGKH